MHRPLSLMLLSLLALPCLPLCAAESYRLDSGNTRVSLGVRVFGVPWISARFEELSGELVPGRRGAPGSTADTPGRIDVTIRTASLKCDSSRWNARLLSPAWFDADRYPQIIYRSDRIDLDADGRAVVTGQLTLHGQTRALVLLVNRWVCSNPPQADDGCSFDAHGLLRRSEYGLPHGLLEGGDEVEISIEGASPRALR